MLSFLFSFSFVSRPFLKETGFVQSADQNSARGASPPDRDLLWKVMKRPLND